MLRVVVKKEILENLTKLELVISSAFCLTLVVLSTLVATEDLTQQQQTHERLMAQDQEQIEAARTLSFVQPTALRAPEILGVFDQDVAARLGAAVKVTLRTVPIEAGGESRGNEFLAVLGRVDVTTIVRVVLGLLALLLTFDAVAGEVESGRLRRILASGVSRRIVLAGKYLGALATVAMPLAAAMLVAIAMLVLRGGVRLTASEWAGIAALWVSYLAYLSLLILIGLSISVRVRTRRGSLQAAVFVWLLFVLLVPSAAATVAGGPIDHGEERQKLEGTLAALIDERDRELESVWREHPMRARFSGHSSVYLMRAGEGAELRRFGSAAYYEALADYYEREVEISLRYADRLYAERLKFEEDLAARSNLARSIGSLSPSYLLDRLAAGFSRTSLADHDEYLASVRDYRLTLIEFLRQSGAFGSWRWFTDDFPTPQPWPTFLGLEPDDVDVDLERYLNQLARPDIEAEMERVSAELQADPTNRLALTDLPRFEHRPKRFGRAIRHAAFDGLALLGLNLVFAATLWSRFTAHPLANRS